MSLRDLVNPMPRDKHTLRDYVLENYNGIKDKIENGSDEERKKYGGLLDQMVDDSFEKYKGYIDEKGLLGKVSKGLSDLGSGIGQISDWHFMATGDIYGTLGGKFWQIMGQLPEKLIYAPIYAIRSGNYLDAVQNVLEGALAYLPGLTFVDQGLERIIQKRMIKDVARGFEKKAGIYKPWTTRLHDKLKDVYTGVKDRLENVFTPDYEPELVAA